MADMEFGMDLVTLVDEDGIEHKFEVADTLELDDEQYMALVASYEDGEEMLEDDGELVILKIMTDENGEEFLEPIEDEAEFDKVADIFMERLEDMFDFEE